MCGAGNLITDSAVFLRPDQGHRSSPWFRVPLRLNTIAEAQARYDEWASSEWDAVNSGPPTTYVDESGIQRELPRPSNPYRKQKVRAHEQRPGDQPADQSADRTADQPRAGPQSARHQHRGAFGHRRSGHWQLAQRLGDAVVGRDPGDTGYTIGKSLDDGGVWLPGNPATESVSSTTQVGLSSGTVLFRGRAIVGASITQPSAPVAVTIP